MIKLDDLFTLSPQVCINKSISHEMTKKKLIPVQGTSREAWILD